jgi:uncharacterized iron-regulated membrane protein
VSGLGKKAWFRIHSFTGVITGLMLFVICWSGTFAVLSHELDWLVTPEARIEAAASEPLSYGQLWAAVTSRYPEAEIHRIETPLYSRSAVQFVVDLPDQDSVRVYVDPYSGEVQGAWSYFNIQRFFRSFHMGLFIPYFGDYFVVLFALTMIVSLVAALYFYKRWWRRFFVFRSSGRAFWSDTHKLLGLWSLWFLLVISITGAWYLFEMLRADVGDGRLSYAAANAYGVQSIPAPASDTALPLLPLDVLLERARQIRPDLELKSIGFNFSHDGAIYFDGQASHLLVRDRANQLQLDMRSGEVLYDQRADEYPMYWRWSDTADPLHFGDFGGLVSKLIWFIFGLLLCLLIYTGTLLHARRLAAGGGCRERHRWPGTSAAILVTLVVMVAATIAGFVEARSWYGPEVDGVLQLPDLAPGVQATLVAWVGATVVLLGLWIRLLWRAGNVGSEPVIEERAIAPGSTG